MSGYIYLRNHESYDTYKAYKLGKTNNIPDRDSQYTTCEILRGEFILVIKIDNIDKVELLLQNNFNNLHVYINGGIEFYKKEIINYIIPYLKSLNLDFKVLTKEEIEKLTRSIKIVKPNIQQQDILNNINIFFDNNKIGKILWSCGLGKTLLSILICKQLNESLKLIRLIIQKNGIAIFEQLNFKKILIGVPTIYLQNQFKNEILKVYPNENNILCIGSLETTNINKIKLFIENNNETIFIITTYTSCKLLINETFDFKIGDEAHHLVGLDNKNYNIFHKIKSNKTLFMTATEKIIDMDYTMDNKETFGKIIDEKTVKWAIENKKITDYNLLIIKNSEQDIDNIIKTLNIKVDNKELFISAFMALKSIEFYDDLTHILVYTNSIENSEIITNYIDEILNKQIINIKKEDIYNNNLHSNKKLNINKEIEKFKNSKYGIISNIYYFSEGFDLPKLNGVVFSENMESDIRVVQSALRPNRLDYNNPNKKAYIIIPYIDSIDWDNKSFNKCRKIISKIRNVDETIEQKITISNIKTRNSNSKEINNYNYSLESNIDQLNNIKLRLKYSRTLESNLSEEQDEYNYIKSINKEMNISSKEEYVINKDNHKNYIDDSEKYFKIKGVWKNWYDFIGFDINQFIKNKDEWIKFCKEINIKSLEDYKEKCKIYKQLPKDPENFYIGFTNIDFELKLNKTRRK